MLHPIKDRKELKEIAEIARDRIAAGSKSFCPKCCAPNRFSCLNCVAELGFIDGFGHAVSDSFYTDRELTEKCPVSFFQNTTTAHIGPCPCFSKANIEEILLHLEQITV